MACLVYVVGSICVGKTSVIKRFVAESPYNWTGACERNGVWEGKEPLSKWSEDEGDLFYNFLRPAVEKGSIDFVRFRLLIASVQVG